MRGRARGLGRTFVAVGISLSVVGAAAAAAGNPVSIRVKPPTTTYRHPHGTTRVTGRVAGGQRNVTVVLEATTWPFTAPFTPAATGHTGKHGVYSFKVRPSLATRVKVTAPATGVVSVARSIYVFPGYTGVSCAITRGSSTFPCSANLPPGAYTVRFSYDYLYPLSAYKTEKQKHVYVYFGQRNGSRQPPSTLTLQGTVSQQALSGNRTHVLLTHHMTIPNSSWEFYISGCTQTSVATDGLGLPGAPGSHHCGAHTITYRQARGNLG